MRVRQRWAKLYRRGVPLAIALTFISTSILWIIALRLSHRSDHAFSQSIESGSPVATDIESASIRREEISALLGSPSDAESLAHRYLQCASREASRAGSTYAADSSKCGHDMKYWFQIAAENGAVGGMVAKVDDLLNDKSCYGAYRASFWLSRLTQNASGQQYGWRKQTIIRAEQHCVW